MFLVRNRQGRQGRQEKSREKEAYPQYSVDVEQSFQILGVLGGFVVNDLISIFS